MVSGSFALAGVVADVVTGNGVWVAVGGHLGAFAGAVLLARPSTAMVGENA